MGFRLVEGVDDGEFKDGFATSLFALIPTVEEFYSSAGELEANSSTKKTRLKLTKKGMMLLNSFLCEAFGEIDEGAKTLSR